MSWLPSSLSRYSLMMLHLAACVGDWNTSEKVKNLPENTSCAKSSTPARKSSARLDFNPDYPIISRFFRLECMEHSCQMSSVDFLLKFMSYENVFHYVSAKMPWSRERIIKSMLNETEGPSVECGRSEIIALTRACDFRYEAHVVLGDPIRW